MEIIEISDEEFDIFKQTIKFKLKCQGCGIRITRKNFGFISNNYYCCRRPFCMLTLKYKLNDENRSATVHRKQDKKTKRYKIRHARN